MNKYKQMNNQIADYIKVSGLNVEEWKWILLFVNECHIL